MTSSRKLLWFKPRVIAALMVLGAALFTGKPAQAAPQYVYNCDFCHHMPPLDSATGKREPATGAVKGNHQSHAGATAATCVKCHGPELTATGHRDKLIQVQGNINTSPLGAAYSRGFINQTSVPPATLGTCSNVNCHFERTTPAWGAAAYATPTDCSSCHGAPPAGTTLNAGTAGSHARHDVYFTGTAQCVKCHPNRLADAKPFAHATSALTAKIKVSLTDPAGTASGSYSGTGASFLPSQGAAQTFGACSNNYCHSTGNTAVAAASLPAVYGSSSFATPTWGSATLACNACHGRSTTNGMPDYANAGTAGSATSNSHVKHVTGSSISCNECHERTTKNNTSIRAIFPSAHVNKSSEVFFNLSGANKAGVYAAAVGSKSCSNTYCHGAAGIQWGGASLACNSCHGASNAGDLSAGTTAGHALHVASATLFTNLTGSSQTTTGAYVFACKSCHPTTSHATGPASALSAASVGGSAITAAQYTAGASSLSDTKGFKYTAGNCSTNNCHSNGRGGAPLTTASWSGAATATCLACHDTKLTGATASTLSAKHDRHMNPTTNALIGLNNGLNCVDCHAKTVSGNTTVSNKTRHVNGFVDYSGVKAGGSARYNSTTKQCSNVYCHSNGNPAAIVYANMTGSKTWGGSATLGCNGCHGRSSSIGAPDYANGGAAPVATANSHAKHVSGSADTTICSTCHVKTASATLGGRFKDYSAASYHLNGSPNVYFSAAKAGAAAAYVPSTGTCNNVSCHGGAGSTAVWGATMNCQDCHGNGATASVADFGTTFWNNGTMSKFQMTGTGSWADTGHGRPTASGNYAGSGNPAANFTGIANFCEWCHDSTIGHNVSGNPFRLRNWTDATWGKNGACMICHATGSAGVTVGGVTRNSASNKVGGYHYGAKHSTALSGGQYCWDCHDPHGTGTSNQYMIRPLVALTSDATTGAPLTQSATAVVFTLSATPTGTDYAKSAAPFNGICNVCHTATGHYTTTAGDAHNAGTRCTSCHSHTGTAGNTGFDPVGGGVSTGGNACFGCHSNFQAAMSITGTSRTSSYHHVLGTSSTDIGDQAPNTGSYPTSTTNVYCTSCHTDHNYFNNGGTVVTKAANLRTDIATTSGATPTNTDFLATGTYGICVSCHTASQTRDTTNQAAGGVATTPIISGSVFATSMHNYTTMSAFGTQLFAANCVKCHNDEQTKDKQTSANKFGPHFSASVSILDDLGTGTLAQYREQYICFRCHSQNNDTALGGTLKATNGKDWFGSNTMRSFAEDTFKSFTAAGRSPRHKISAYTGQHKANETLADIALAKHVECADCHSPHAAKFGNHSSTVATTARGSRANTIAGVLTGVSGVTVTTWGAASVTTNWGANANTYGQSGATALPNATLEYQVCFKCHSNAMGSTGWFKNMTSAGQMGGKALAWTDLGVEFNPNNASRHPIGTPLAATKLLTTSGTNAPKMSNGWTTGGVMTCSDCHQTDSTASKGPHGSSVKWMLAGTNKAWPYTSAAMNGGLGNASMGSLYYMGNATDPTKVGTVNGLFCLNCHTVRGTNAFHNQVAGWGATGHSGWGYTGCAVCHIRVPHGGKISRLLNTVKSPARYRPDGNGAATYFSSWAPMGNNTTDTTSGRWSGSCGTHSGGTESW